MLSPFKARSSHQNLYSAPYEPSSSRSFPWNHFVPVLRKLRWLLRKNSREKKSDFDVLLTVLHLSIFISVFNQLDAQNLFHNKFYFMSVHVSSTCAHHQEVKIALHSLWYHHTETSEWSKITKIQFYKYEQIKFYYYLLIFTELYFSNFRPLTCFSVMIPEAV